MLNQILQARAEEVIELIYNEIRRSGYEGAAAGRGGAHRRLGAAPALR